MKAHKYFVAPGLLAEVSLTYNISTLAPKNTRNGCTRGRFPVRCLVCVQLQAMYVLYIEGEYMVRRGCVCLEGDPSQLIDVKKSPFKKRAQMSRGYLT